MAWDDTCLLVVTSGVASQLEDFSRQIFKNSCQVNRGTSTDAFSVITLAEQTMNTTNRELETSTG
ncbi:unnamed protein product [Schistosoma turkestanicum]|nr:unnamed protein product [Schistosoma turkestanicum]